MKKPISLNAILLSGFLLAPAHASPGAEALPSAKRLSNQEFRDATDAELTYGVLQRRLIGFIRARCGAIAQNQYGLLDLALPASLRGCQAADQAPPPKMLAKLVSGASATAVFCPDRAPVVDCGR